MNMTDRAWRLSAIEGLALVAAMITVNLSWVQNVC